METYCLLTVGTSLWRLPDRRCTVGECGVLSLRRCRSRSLIVVVIVAIKFRTRCHSVTLESMNSANRDHCSRALDYIVAGAALTCHSCILGNDSCITTLSDSRGRIYISALIERKGIRADARVTGICNHSLNPRLDPNHVWQFLG